MPRKMNNPWSFKPWDGPMYHTGTIMVEDRHVKQALQMGARFVEETPETVVEPVSQKTIAQTPEVTEPVRKTGIEKTKEWQAKVKLVKRLGFNGRINRDTVYEFLTKKGYDPETLEVIVKEPTVATPDENRGSQVDAEEDEDNDEEREDIP